MSAGVPQGLLAFPENCWRSPRSAAGVLQGLLLAFSKVLLLAFSMVCCLFPPGLHLVSPRSAGVPPGLLAFPENCWRSPGCSAGVLQGLLLAFSKVCCWRSPWSAAGVPHGLLLAFPMDRCLCPQGLLTFTNVCCRSPRPAGVPQGLLAFPKVCWRSPRSAGVLQGMLAFPKVDRRFPKVCWRPRRPAWRSPRSAACIPMVCCLCPQGLLELPKICWSYPRSAAVPRGLLAFTKVCWRSPRSAGVRQGLLAFTIVC